MLKRLEKQVQKNLQKNAYQVNNKSITYEELWNKANTYASLLKSEGNTPVIIYGNKSINVIVSIFACLIAKRAYVPIGLCTPIERLKTIIELSKSTLILTDEDIKLNNIKVSTLEDLKEYKDKEALENNNDIAYIIFTSGSTGVPKGVPISYSNLENFINWISNINPLSSYKDINVLNQASFSFDLSVADLYYSFMNGHTLIAFDNDIQSEYDKVFDLMKDIDVAVMTPTFIKLCLLNKDFNSINYPRFKCVYFCGEVLDKKTVSKLFNQFPNLRIINAYGPTEATSAVSSIEITKDMLDKYDILPVGNMNTNACNIEIIDDEIILSGKSVFNGYLGNITGGFFKKNNKTYYKTGDIGFIKDNLLFCKGRIDNQIKYKGYRIELNDIEENINSINGVINSVVIPRFNEENICKGIIAYVISNRFNEEDIKKELLKLLPKYMIPSSIKIVENLPINCNCKLDRKALSDSIEKANRC